MLPTSSSSSSSWWHGQTHHSILFDLVGVLTLLKSAHGQIRKMPKWPLSWGTFGGTVNEPPSLSWIFMNPLVMSPLDLWTFNFHLPTWSLWQSVVPTAWLFCGVHIASMCLLVIWPFLEWTNDVRSCQVNNFLQRLSQSLLYSNRLKVGDHNALAVGSKWTFCERWIWCTPCCFFPFAWLNIYWWYYCTLSLSILVAAVVVLLLKLLLFAIVTWAQRW